MRLMCTKCFNQVGIIFNAPTECPYCWKRDTFFWKKKKKKFNLSKLLKKLWKH